MKLNRTLQKKPFIKPVIVGFVVFYLFSMYGMTWLQKESYEKAYELQMQNIVDSIQEHIYQTTSNSKITPSLREDRVFAGFLRNTLSSIANNNSSLAFSAAIYDQNKKLIAQKGTLIGRVHYVHEELWKDFGEYHYYYYILEDYLTDTQLKKLVEIHSQNNRPVNYRIQDSDGELLQLWIEESSSTSKILWEWNNPKFTQTELNNIIFSTDTTLLNNDYLLHPFYSSIHSNEEGWNLWFENEYLRSFSDYTYDVYTPEGFQDAASEGAHLGDYDFISPIYRADMPDQVYTLKIRTTAKPWKDAMNETKTIYLWGLIFILVCIVKIIRTTTQTYNQQLQLEQNRRDFTNAIAHELKNPLNIIRGFAENLKENTKAEKRDYYLDHIISQTEEMDTLVQEMIQVSKLDSNQLVLKKEPLSLLLLCQKQAEKFQVQLTEQNLSVFYNCKEDFIIDGDKDWLEKAIWNLLSNAVSYNTPNGSITITSEANRFILENTGTPILPEDMPHVFDMLYTSDKSRTSSVKNSKKHLGMGLYLAQKIFHLHKIKIAIDNTPTGVCVTISK